MNQLNKVLADIASRKRAKAFAGAEDGLSFPRSATHFVAPERKFLPPGWYSFPQGHCNHGVLFILPCSRCKRSKAEAVSNVMRIV